MRQKLRSPTGLFLQRKSEILNSFKNQDSAKPKKKDDQLGIGADMASSNAYHPHRVRSTRILDVGQMNVDKRFVYHVYFNTRDIVYRSERIKANSELSNYLKTTMTGEWEIEYFSDCKPAIIKSIKFNDELNLYTINFMFQERIRKTFIRE